ncbi:TetR/AcrR family transcriptional regulator [Maribacter sp. 2304DJ31-5]|uniref:TetR/AcrR family transcriptional regulator n=1 Tax=Maribacter sp. 2304DJ31-5 TaxID=3386273 RepID=UPI0039BC8D84
MKVHDRIIATATNLFHTQGYNSTGINQIIQEASVAKGSFYYNFKSKEEVCVACLNTRHHYWFQQLKRAIEKEGDSRKKILASFDFLIEMNEKEHFRGCNFLNILSEISNDNTKILKVIQNHKSDLRNYFSSFIANDLLSDHIYLLFESAIIESRLYQKQWPIEKAKTIIKSIIE